MHNITAFPTTFYFFIRNFDFLKMISFLKNKFFEKQS